MQPSEQRIQKGLLDWWHLASAGYGLDERLLFAIPNGGKRRPIEAAIFKGMGVRSGVEDVFLAVARGTKHGLFLELKSADGGLSVAQREMMALHAEQNYATCVAWSLTESISAVVSYLRSGEPLIR